MKKTIPLLLVMGIVFVTIFAFVTVQAPSDESKITATNSGAQETEKKQNQIEEIQQQEEIVYSNSQYGFHLTFPPTWKGYTAKNRTLDWGAFGTSNSVDFGFSVQDSLFNISIHPKSQWEQITSEEGPVPSYLGENSQYVFSFAIGQDAANDIVLARMNEVQDIVKTFKVFMNTNTPEETAYMPLVINNNTRWVRHTAKTSNFSFEIPKEFDIRDMSNEQQEVYISPEKIVYNEFVSGYHTPIVMYSGEAFQRMESLLSEVSIREESIIQGHTVIRRSGAVEATYPGYESVVYAVEFPALGIAIVTTNNFSWNIEELIPVVDHIANTIRVEDK